MASAWASDSSGARCRTEPDDGFYAASPALSDSPQRNRLFLEMTRQMQVDGAWKLHVAELLNEIIHPWIEGYKKHPILQADYMYLDVVPHSDDPQSIQNKSK